MGWKSLKPFWRSQPASQTCSDRSEVADVAELVCSSASLGGAVSGKETVKRVGAQQTVLTDQKDLAAVGRLCGDVKGWVFLTAVSIWRGRKWTEK